ncbi:MAG: HIT family protein [Parachlamydiales bacterium]|nr:HIT family protein [Parachlamydiales bacterium]
MQEDCLYCKIASGKEKCHKVYEDDEFLAFLSIFPNTEGLTYLITKQHHPAYLFDLDDDLLTSLLLKAKQIAKILDTKLDDVGRTALILEPSFIDHAHVKLIPMHGTKNISKWKPEPTYLDKYFKKYEGYLSSHDSLRKDDKELEKLVKKISSN